MPDTENLSELLATAAAEDHEKRHEDALSRMQERARRVQFSIYRAMKMHPDDAAQRAGYTLKEVNQKNFLENLETRCQQAGLLAAVETPIRVILMSELRMSISVMVDTRDHAKSEKLRFEAAKELAALCGTSAATAIKMAPEDLAERALKELSPADQTRALAVGQWPLALPGMVPVEEAQEQAPTTDQQIKEMLEAEMEGDSPLA